MPTIGGVIGVDGCPLSLVIVWKVAKTLTYALHAGHMVTDCISNHSDKKTGDTRSVFDGPTSEEIATMGKVLTVAIENDMIAHNLLVPCIFEGLTSEESAK